MKTLSITDLVYEAAAVPELWPEVLDRLAAVVSCNKAVFFAVDEQGISRWIANEAAYPAMEIFVGERWMERNTQAARTMALSEPRFIHDLDLFTREEIDQDAFYASFLRPNGLAWGTGTYIAATPGNRIMVSIHRSFEEGPLEQQRVDMLTALRPDIARATFLSARLRLEQTRTNLAALEAVGLPAAALSVRGEVRMATPSFEALFPGPFVMGRDRIHFHDRAVDLRFERTLMASAAGLTEGASFALQRGQGISPLLLHLMPIRGAAQDIFSGLSHVLIAVPVKVAPNVEVSLLQGLFDLTAAEARIAKAVVSGQSLDSAAQQYGISHETARSHMKSVLAKTGTHRQSEFVALVAPAFGKVSP